MALSKPKIGIVGLGTMGQGIASNFLKNKYQIFVWNRTESLSKTMERKGAIVCSTPKEVSQKSDIIFEITANDQSSKKIWLGENGILSGADKKKVLIASATLSVDWTDRIAKECKKRGFKFIDIPLTGGRVGAETGKLTLLCGGDEETLKKITPALKAISSKIFHFGPAGHGMRYKLILNHLQAIHIVGFGQAMKIAKANGMDLEKVGGSLAERPGGVITSLAWSDYQKDPDPINFTVEWITKDLSYAKKFAKNLDVSLLDKVLAEYKKAMKRGLSKKDWTSVNKMNS